MKLLLFVALILSVNALDTTDRSRLERVEESLAGVKSNMANMEEKMAAMESSMSDLQLSIKEILLVLKPQVEPSQQMVIGERRGVHMEYPRGDVSIIPSEPSDNFKMNDTDLEVRVQALEFQMGNVQEDLTGVVDEVADLEDNVGVQITNVEGQITLIQAEQLVQDQRILDVEDETEILETDITDLRVSDLEINLSLNELQLNGTELDSRLDELESLDVGNELINVDSRLNKLELAGTVAFHAHLTAYDSIPENTPVVFNVVNINLGSGYDTTTGEFTVPPEGAGLYYFYFHFEGPQNEISVLRLRRNTVFICDAVHDTRNSADYGTVSCGAVVDLVEGDVIDVFNNVSTDDTPVTSGGDRTTFLGFRVAPQ